MRADALAGELALELGIGEARRGPDFAVRRRALGHAGQRRAHLSGRAEDQDIAIERLQVGDQIGIGAGQPLLQGLDISEPAGRRLS